MPSAPKMMWKHPLCPFHSLPHTRNRSFRSRFQKSDLVARPQVLSFGAPVRALVFLAGPTAFWIGPDYQTQSQQVKLWQRGAQSAKSFQHCTECVIHDGCVAGWFAQDAGKQAGTEFEHCKCFFLVAHAQEHSAVPWWTSAEGREVWGKQMLAAPPGAAGQQVHPHVQVSLDPGMSEGTMDTLQVHHKMLAKMRGWKV